MLTKQYSKVINHLDYRLAKRYHKKRVHDTMVNQYHELGMTSVVFVCYRDTDGKIVVNWYVISSSYTVIEYFFIF
jgi:hypothetical protein